MQAQQLNKDIFETMYYHALKASSELAMKEGTYETYNGSPVSKVCFWSFITGKPCSNYISSKKLHTWDMKNLETHGVMILFLLGNLSADMSNCREHKLYNVKKKKTKKTRVSGKGRKI